MDISSNTKISALIKENPACIEAIVSINKHFEKLRNPILRKILASRVTIADAARIGKCSVEDFFKKLEPLGFTISITDKTKEPIKSSNLKPDFMNTIKDNTITTLDVRAELASGKDPFKTIMQTISSMPEENTLLIINTFEPIPLINLLKKKGYEYFTELPEKGLVHTYLKKTGMVKPEILEEVTQNTELEFEKVLKDFIGKTKTIDVRNLEMPLPMVTILEELSSLPEGNALFVHHKKVPQFLLPELKERKFKCLIHEIDEGNVKLLIYR